MALSWEDVVALAIELPKVEVSTSYNTPALKASGKLIARLRTEAEGSLVVMCSMDEKAALLGSGEQAFFTTPHYDGYGSILVDLDLVDPGELKELLIEAWRGKATKTVREQYDKTH
ncbi:MmcQ/YjbR family DNA-binding protein [Rhodococcus sp. G-MC3]|uniref:MmcQ/YjbR family DNA-binding protein n=1 Tax=Rhodococcus sp. G-MC3 TaxID=3046209 RepID=UPI0024B94DB2|nr:MmcQ/YjbR family DNA-binding protein [Rhodococcus sp. G-MC3]MDJ0395546.1 MmcQ/YjbR family DNA-binding protein [Rhodococcus sp. G-MC3]